MRIIILGSNPVSETLAENLASEENDIVLIDTNHHKLKELQNRYDIQTVIGHGSYPDVLAQAQAEDTEMLIAVSTNEEVNMLACQVAYSLFHIPLKIARIRSENYLVQPELFDNESLPIDVIISPEQLITDQIKQMIDYPGVFQLVDFADGQVNIINIKATIGGELINQTLQQARKLLAKTHSHDNSSHIIAIHRQGSFIQLTDELVIAAGDEVFCVAKKSNISTIIAKFRPKERRNHSVIIAGGGNIGSRLARSLEQHYHVKLIECNPKVAEQMSIHLDKTIVIDGIASDRNLLNSEGIEHIDVFCAMTNDDEANIMACLQAKLMGAKHVIALVANSCYLEIIEDSKIDIVVSPQLATTSSILAYIRRGDIVKVHTLRRGEAEALEIIVHGDEQTSDIVGRQICDIPLVDDVYIAALVRAGVVLPLDEPQVIQSQDHVIVFVSNRKRIKAVEKLFQVKFNFV